MNILVPGSKDLLKAYKKFNCSFCGCEFVAEMGEYNSAFDFSGRRVFDSYCPTCNKLVFTTNPAYVNERGEYIG